MKKERIKVAFALIALAIIVFMRSFNRAFFLVLLGIVGILVFLVVKRRELRPVHWLCLLCLVIALGGLEFYIMMGALVEAAMNMP